MRASQPPGEEPYEEQRMHQKESTPQKSWKQKAEIQVSLETKSGEHFPHAIRMNKSHVWTQTTNETKTRYGGRRCGFCLNSDY